MSFFSSAHNDYLDPEGFSAPEFVDELPAEEFWRSVYRAAETYEVSNLGNVRRKGSEQNLKKNYPSSTKIAWINIHGEARRVDKIVLESFVCVQPDPTWGPRHLNGDNTDDSLVNLEWGEGLSSPNNSHPGSRKKKPSRAKPKPKKAVSQSNTKKLPVVPSTGVREMRMYYSGDVEVIVNMTDGTVDLSQQQGSPIMALSNVSDLIKCLQAIVGEKVEK